MRDEYDEKDCDAKNVHQKNKVQPVSYYVQDGS